MSYRNRIFLPTHTQLNMTRWNLDIPEEADRAVRTFLKQNGKTMDDLSEFVNDAVRRRIMEFTVSKIKGRNATHDQSEILAVVDEEVEAVRGGRS